MDDVNIIYIIIEKNEYKNKVLELPAKNRNMYWPWWVVSKLPRSVIIKNISAVMKISPKQFVKYIQT